VSVLKTCGLVIGAVAVFGYLTNPGGGHVGLDATKSTKPSARAVGDIPVNYLAIYKKHGHTCRHLDWALLAAIGKIETNHGRSTLPGVSSGANYANARGPMQFLPATFAGVRNQHPDVGGNIYDPHDAIPAAAHMLCDNGVARGDVRTAVFSYNHADWYVNKVLAQADTYR
jgi:hypothetical protein